MSLDNPLNLQFYPLWKRVKTTDTTFQTQGRFQKTSSGATNPYQVGKQMFVFNYGNRSQSSMELFYMNVSSNPTLIDSTNGVYEYNIGSIDYRGVDSDNTDTPPTKYQSANIKNHEAGALVAIVNAAEYWQQISDEVADTINDKVLQGFLFDATTDVSVGDGRMYFSIPAKFNSHNLTRVYAKVFTAGTTGTTDIQIYNVTDSVDMLSTKLTIDSGETGSDTAATPAVIDTAHDDVVTNDLLRIDIDAVSTTAPKGLIVVLEFTPA